MRGNISIEQKQRKKDHGSIGMKKPFLQSEQRKKWKEEKEKKEEIILLMIIKAMSEFYHQKDICLDSSQQDSSFEEKQYEDIDEIPLLTTLISRFVEDGEYFDMNDLYKDIKQIIFLYKNHHSH